MIGIGAHRPTNDQRACSARKRVIPSIRVCLSLSSPTRWNECSSHRRSTVRLPAAATARRRPPSAPCDRAARERPAWAPGCRRSRRPRPSARADSRARHGHGRQPLDLPRDTGCAMSEPRASGPSRPRRAGGAPGSTAGCRAPRVAAAARAPRAAPAPPPGPVRRLGQLEREQAPHREAADGRGAATGARLQSPRAPLRPTETSRSSASPPGRRASPRAQPAWVPRPNSRAARSARPADAPRTACR